MNKPPSTACLQKLLLEAQRLYEQERYLDCRELCNKVLLQNGPNFHSLYIKALASHRLGHKVEAEWLMREALVIRPDTKRFDFMVGVLRQQQRDDWLTIHETGYRRLLLAESTDVFIISYPKCGRTWLRLMLGRYLLGPGKQNYLDTFKITQSRSDVPTIEFTHDDFPHWKPFHALHTDKAAYEGKDVVFLVRDPRDVLVSYYFEYTKRGSHEITRDTGFKGTISDFIDYEIGGLRSIIGFYNAWASARHIPRNFYLMRYEDFITNTASTFEELLHLLQIFGKNQEPLSDIIAYGSFENMRALEEADTLQDPRLRAPGNRDPEAYKVRRGQVGGYKNYFSASEISYIDQYLQDELDDLYASYKANK